MLHKLAVITVIYKNYNILSDFLDSFSKQKNKNFKIFIADLSDVKKLIKPTPFVQIINGQNKGYAYGINLGLKEAVNQDFDKFVVINNDTRIANNFINQVLESIEKHPKSIIGGKIYYEKSFEYHKDRYKKEDLGKIIWYAGGKIDWRNAVIKHRGVDEVDKGEYDRFELTDFITGCLMCFDKTVIDNVGLWDEKYFLYYEDADYYQKAREKGISLYYDPSIIIWHKNAASTGGSGSKLHHKYQDINRLRFGLKYAPIKTKIHLIKNHYRIALNLLLDWIKQ